MARETALKFHALAVVVDGQVIAQVAATDKDGFPIDGHNLCEFAFDPLTLSGSFRLIRGAVEPPLTAEENKALGG